MTICNGCTHVVDCDEVALLTNYKIDLTRCNSYELNKQLLANVSISKVEVQLEFPFVDAL